MSSGNSLDFTKEDMERMLQHGVAVKEMEAAAIAWSAHLFGTPMFALKSITDIVDGAPLDTAACQCQVLRRLCAACMHGAMHRMVSAVRLNPVAVVLPIEHGGLGALLWAPLGPIILSAGDRPTHEEFLENLAAAAQSLQEKLPQVRATLQLP